MNWQLGYDNIIVASCLHQVFLPSSFKYGIACHNGICVSYGTVYFNG